MTACLPRWAGVAATVAVALLVTVPAAPATAAPVVTVTRPTEGAVLESSTVNIAGRVEVGGLSSIREVFLTLDETRHNVACQASPCSFTWAPNLPRNGRYEVTVSATDQTLFLEGEKVTLTRKFVVEAPPARPALEPPKVTESRTVELTWSRNTEPDMLFYAVFRKDPGGTAYNPVGTVKQPETGGTVSFVDPATAINGGEFSYQVVAVRKGGVKPEIASAPSVVRTAGVPVPPPTTVVPAPGAPVAGGTTTTVKPGAAAGADLSGFLAARSRVAPTPPPTIIEPPDTGFAGELPFGARPPGEELEEGEAEAVLPDTERSTSSIASLDVGRPLVPVAAGLVLLLLAMHLRVLNRRLKPAGGGDLPIETPPAAVPPPPSPVADAALDPPPVAWSESAREPDPDPDPEPDPEPDDRWAPGPEPAGGPAPALYDVAEDANEGWKPEWTEPEPDDELVSQLVLAAEAEAVEPATDPDEVEVVDVIGSTHRVLARSGSR